MSERHVPGDHPRPDTRTFPKPQRHSRAPAGPQASRFPCPACGERLTYRERRCGRCNEESPVYNLPVFWRWFYATLLFCFAFVTYQLTM